MGTQGLVILVEGRLEGRLEGRRDLTIHCKGSKSTLALVHTHTHAHTCGRTQGVHVGVNFTYPASLSLSLCLFVCLGHLKRNRQQPVYVMALAHEPRNMLSDNIQVWLVQHPHTDKRGKTTSGPTRLYFLVCL